MRFNFMKITKRVENDWCLLYNKCPCCVKNNSDTDYAYNDM